MDTFEHGLMWGGMILYPLAENVSLYNAFYMFNINHDRDPKAALILSTACIQGLGCFFSTEYTYTDPIATPQIFENFTIMNSSGTTGIRTLSRLTTELKDSQPNGFRLVAVRRDTSL